MTNRVYAGFWIRVGATVIDFLVLLPLIAIYALNIINWRSIPLMFVVNIAMIAYKPLMEWKYSATVGKMAVKIQLINKDGQPISFQQSIARYGFWILSSIVSVYTTYLTMTHELYPYLTDIEGISELQNSLGPQAMKMATSLLLLVSVLMVIFNRKKQGLHDLIAETYCVQKVPKGQEESETTETEFEEVE